MTNNLSDEIDDSQSGDEARKAEPNPSHTLKVQRTRPDETMADAVAHAVLRPTVGAATTLMRFGKGTSKQVELMPLINALAEQTAAVNSGQMGRGEAMLAAQAHTLDAIFNSLAQRAAANVGAGYLEATETYMKLALRAQSQARSTWEAVSAIQNPPIARYVGQANVAHGPQQVNNGSRAGESQHPPSELSGATDELRANPGAPRVEKKASSPLETLGEVHRAEISRGKG